MPDRAESSPPSSSSLTRPGNEPAVPRSARPQRLIAMGTGPFAVPAFDALRRAGHSIVLVVTRPQWTSKSRKLSPPSPVRAWAEAHQLAIVDPESINDATAVQRLDDVAADLLVVCDYGQILQPAALASARLGGINLHGSLLPKYRGAAPVQRALLGGEAITGVSVIHMTPRLDAGPVLAMRQTSIGDRETAGELEQRLAELGVAATIEAVELLAGWDGHSPIGQLQDPAQVSKAPRLDKSEGQIDWARTARQIDCHVRGMQPWPIAFTHCPPGRDKPPLRLAIKQIRQLDRPADDHRPGEIVAGDGLLVATADRIVQIELLQPAGKRDMTGEEFLRGHKPVPGSQLG